MFKHERSCLIFFDSETINKQFIIHTRHCCEKSESYVIYNFAKMFLFLNIFIIFWDLIKQIDSILSWFNFKMSLIGS